jgi:hypothetical protein
MTKHRMITGFVAVVLLLAAAAAAATIRPPSTDRAIASAGVASLKDLAADANKLRTDDFEGQVLGAKERVRYEAVIANWKRYRSATKPN